ncbi:hypothetical protein vseg_005167 [Gypsophila vaccaria]
MSTKIDNDHVFWNESFSLECNGAQTSIDDLKEENIVFELRMRNTSPNLLGKRGGSQLIARAEITWKSVFDTPDMVTLEWVSMTRAEKVKCEEHCCMESPPALQVGIKVECTDLSRKVVSSEETKTRRRRERLKNWDGCGCISCNEGCCSCVDNELLFVGASLDYL